MKTLATLIGIMVPVAAYAVANASTGNDGVFAWVFLGFFSLIIVRQLVPAVMLMAGLVRDGALQKLNQQLIHGSRFRRDAARIGRWSALRTEKSGR